MMNKIIFRVDGNSQIGLGHLYRAIALADLLKDTFDSCFLVRVDTITTPLKNANFLFQYIPRSIAFEDEPEWIFNNFKEYDTIVLDGYQFKESYQTKIKSLNKKLIYIDDLAQGTQKADVVINHSPNVKKTDYAKEGYTKLALGLEYAILRKSFIENIGKTRKLNDCIEKVFILFGGADPNDFTFKTAHNILELEHIISVTVILGAAYKHKKIFKIKNGKLNIYKDQSEEEVFHLMSQSDLAIVPASTTSLELASLKIPMILGYFVDNQRNIYNGFVENNAVFDVGDFRTYDFSKLKGLITRINVSSRLNEKSKALSTMFKSYDRNKVLNLFEKDSISLRYATKFDMTFVLNLSNEPEVRQNSFNSDPIILEDHKKWFDNILKTKGLYYIIEHNKNPVGQIRFEEKEEFSIIGISVSNKFRGKGFAKKGLIMAVKYYFNEHSKPILAYIKNTNVPSITIFQKANFSFYKEDFKDGVNSDVYIKRK